MDLDLLINIVRPAISGQIGHRSKYTENVHPGTNKKIKGWQWGEFMWPMYSELSEYSYAPTLFDAEIKIPRAYYQSGYAGDEDLLLKSFKKIKQNELNKWVPKIQTGDYFIHDKRWHLFSDQYISEKLSIDANNYHNLGYKPKELSPIFVRNYKRDVLNSELVISQEIKFKVSVNENGDMQPPEAGTFTVDNSGGDNGPRLIFNPADGVINSSSFTFSVTEDTTAIQLPVFPVEIANVPTNWSLDEDLGTLHRDTIDTNENGQTLTVTYVPKFLVTYDPFFSKEEVDGFTANANPLHVGTNRGFVQITTEILEPYSLELTADLELVHEGYPNSYQYILDLGNNVGKLKATVKNRVGTLLEGIRVYFDWEGQVPGGYGDHDDDVSSISDGYGNAYMPYTSPTTISDVGFFIHKSNITYENGLSSFIPSESFAASSLNEIFIYEVRHDDPFYALDENEIDTYYSTYLQEEEITSTPGGSTSKEFEQWYRKRLNPYLHEPHSLPKGIDITDVKETEGQKRLLFKVESVLGDDEYVDPNTGTRGDVVFAPLVPESAEVDGATELRYDVNLTTPNNNVHQYFVVSNRKIKARAWARNAAGQRIFSNEISINITLPGSVNGMYYAQALNGIPAHHKERLLRTSSELTNNYSNLDPITHVYQIAEESEKSPATNEVAIPLVPTDDDKATIPLGFRIKDAGITVAGLLDQVTFITKEN